MVVVATRVTTKVRDLMSAYLLAVTDPETDPDVVVMPTCSIPCAVSAVERDNAEPTDLVWFTRDDVREFDEACAACGSVIPANL